MLLQCLPVGFSARASRIFASRAACPRACLIRPSKPARSSGDEAPFARLANAFTNWFSAL